MCPPPFCSGAAAAAGPASEVLLMVMRCCMDEPLVAKQWMLEGYKVPPPSSE